jgi:hypothetical protein
LRDGWQRARLNAPTKVLILVAVSYVLISNAPAWIGLATALICVYAAYLVVWSLAKAGQPRPAAALPNALPGQPPANGAPAPALPVPARAAAAPMPYARRPAHRNRAELIRVLLTKSPREQMIDVLGSMLLAALVMAALCVVMALFLPSQPQWNQLAWLGLVGTIGSWAIIIPSKLWETRAGEPMMRRFVLLLIGLGLGLAAYAVDVFLLAQPQWMIVELPASAMEGYQRSLFSDSMAPNLKGYLAYCAFLFPVLRWWKQADPLRPARLSLWPVLCVAFWAWVLHVAWPFPQPWGVMLAVAISVTVQLATPWLSLDERRRVGLPLTREE